MRSKRHIGRYIFLYFAVVTIPVFLGLSVWQANRNVSLKGEINRLEENQAEWVESNNQLIAGIAVLSSPDRIEDIAKNDLGLQKIHPENVLQVKLRGGKGHGL